MSMYKDFISNVNLNEVMIQTRRESSCTLDYPPSTGFMWVNDNHQDILDTYQKNQGQH